MQINLCHMQRLLLFFLLSPLLALTPVSANLWNIPPPNLTARAYVLIDAQSGAVLAAHNADQRLPPASLTKLMTAYILFGDLRSGALKLDELVTVSRYASQLTGARMFLSEAERVPVEALIMGMLVQSGNDATFALIEHASGTLPVFVARMNAMAADLGLNNSHFANATGLSNPHHYSSARDLTRLAVALKRDYPEYARWFSVKKYRWAGIEQPNRNQLLKDDDVDGLKTGHIETAGYCLAASAQRNDMRLIATLLGSKSESDRARDGRQLLDFGFHRFETRLLYRSGIPVTTLPVGQGELNDVALGAQLDTWVTLPRGSFDELYVRAIIPDYRLAPVELGEALGQMNLEHNGKVFATLPLVAQTSVPAGNFLKRSMDRIVIWFRK